MVKPASLIKFCIGAVIAAVILTYGLWGTHAGLPVEIPDGETLRGWFADLGAWGPVAVIGAMTIAILVSPIPSAPIALTAGAMYGHFWGALYVLAGSELGAVIAFCISRFFGYDLIRGWLGDRLDNSLAGSQNVLMLTVFGSRLLPFISFDIVSYAAGLTPLSLWRFALATLAGIIPASFLLAHFGSELVAEETDRILIAILVLGVLAAIPVIARALRKFDTE